MVRVAITAGMAQANPERRGTNAFPCRPTDFISRSITNATRARYPESSMNAISRKSSAICGTKTTTLPTPATTPSAIRSWNGPSLIKLRTRSCAPVIPFSTIRISGSAQVKSASKTTNITNANAMSPCIGCVRTRSIRSDQLVTSRPGLAWAASMASICA